mmetsp:Transcript_9004/g.10299  ORF Transcript_9004/g.10299 Transcript_9004/m.10299 type:complete len:269 (-) Transcript_9004:314-1120(-)
MKTFFAVASFLAIVSQGLAFPFLFGSRHRSNSIHPVFSEIGFPSLERILEPHLPKFHPATLSGVRNDIAKDSPAFPTLFRRAGRPDWKNSLWNLNTNAIKSPLFDLTHTQNLLEEELSKFYHQFNRKGSTKFPRLHESSWPERRNFLPFRIRNNDENRAETVRPWFKPSNVPKNHFRAQRFHQTPKSSPASNRQNKVNTEQAWENEKDEITVPREEKRSHKDTNTRATVESESEGLTILDEDAQWPGEEKGRWASDGYVNTRGEVVRY